MPLGTPQVSQLLDEVALDLHDAYALKNIKALTLRYDGDTVVVICKDAKLAVNLMERALEELKTPAGETLQ
jgi:hypothetical protein